MGYLDLSILKSDFIRLDLRPTKMSHVGGLLVAQSVFINKIQVWISCCRGFKGVQIHSQVNTWKSLSLQVYRDKNQKFDPSAMTNFKIKKFESLSKKCHFEVKLFNQVSNEKFSTKMSKFFQNRKKLKKFFSNRKKKNFLLPNLILEAADLNFSCRLWLQDFFSIVKNHA